MVNDAWHECQRPEDAAKLVDDIRARGEAALSGCHHVVERSRAMTVNHEGTKSTKTRDHGVISRLRGLRGFVMNSR